MDGNVGERGAAQAELTPKEVGGFRILRRLASGAASDVLLARAEGPHGFQRVVALKLLLAHTKDNPEFERHFAAEASAYARLSHPAVVKLYDFFAADGQLVMVLEFVDGLPLHKLRAMLAIAGERIDDKAALFLGLRIFSALAAAHGARDPATGEFSPIAHSDVNPSNILVPWDGHVKLGDFGIARAAGVESDPRSGFIKGTYGYVAPEQVSGGAVTVRSDVYSAGLIVWELLARRKAVQRGSLSDAQVLKAMTHPEFPALELLRPDLDAAVRTAIRRALEPDPEKRAITAEEMVNVLRQAVVAEDGRKLLADALTRVRSGGAGDPLAATTEVPLNADIDAHGPPTPHRPPSRDPEQTAPFQALTDDGADLGKIAFYGRLKLPAESDPPQRRPPSAPGLPAVVPPEPTTVVDVMSPVRDLPSPASPRPPLVSSPLVSSPPVSSPPAPVVTTSSPPRGRAIPRPGLDKKNSNYPTMPAPPLVPDEEEAGPRLVAAGAPPPVRMPPPKMGPPTPITQIAPAPVLKAAAELPSPVADVLPAAGTPPAPTPAIAAIAAEPVPVLEPAAHTPPPLPTEAAPEPTFPAAPVVAESAPFPPMPPPVAAAPAYVETSVAPPPSRASSRGGMWFLLAIVGAGLAGAGGFFLLRGSPEPATDGAPATTAPASAASPSPGVPSATASATASTGPAESASAGPAVSSAPPPSAAPSSSAAELAEPTPSASAAAPAASTSPSSAPAVASSAPSSAPAAAASPPSSSPVPSDMGELELPASAAGHRIFVDDKVAGEGSAPIRVHCGSHVVRLGSAGKERKLDVPCGGTIDVP